MFEGIYMYTLILNLSHLIGIFMFCLFSTPAIYMSVTQLTPIFNYLITLQRILYSFAEDWTNLFPNVPYFLHFHPHYSFRSFFSIYNHFNISTLCLANPYVRNKKDFKTNSFKLIVTCPVLLNWIYHLFFQEHQGMTDHLLSWEVAVCTDCGVIF